MIHITRERKGYAVKSVADNGELLATSETLKTKQACYKNIRAMMEVFWTLDMFVPAQDDTLKKPQVFKVTIDDKYPHDLKPKPRYITGKNPKKKK